jgi:hypothetical protein
MSTANPAQLTFESLRDLHKVRPLKKEEEGSAVAKLSAGVYGYTCAPGFDEVPIFSKKTYHSFEVHKASDGTEYLLGYVTPQEAAELDTRNQGKPVRLFPEAWEASTSLVSVPFSDIQAPKRLPPREDGNPFPFNIA